MTAIATGVFKTVAFKRQTGVGVIAAGGAATGQFLRRVKSTLDLTKGTFKSAEILPSQQRRDYRHGVWADAGTISGELSSGGYQAFLESLARQVAVAKVTTGAVTTISISSASGHSFSISRSSGSFITDGFKGRDVVNVSGFTTTGAIINNRYGQISTLTATAMTISILDGLATAGAVQAAGDSVTVIHAGKTIYPPTSGQVKHYYTIEHWFGDIAQSEVFYDVVVTQAQIKMPPTGLATIDFPCMGLNYQEGATEYFTSPTAAATGGIQASVNGFIQINNVQQLLVTGLDLTINGNYSVPGGVVGSVTDPDVFPGVIDASGTVTALLADASLVDLFLNEVEFGMTVILQNPSTGTVAQPDFIQINMPRCKSGGASKDDGEKGIVLTFPFAVLENYNNSSIQLDTTFSIQDNKFT